MIERMGIGVLLLCLGATPAPAAEQTALDQPLMIGGSPDTPACGGGAIVVGLDPQGDNFLSVRSGPGGKAFRERDRITSGMRVKVCDMIGPWYGIVYSPSGTNDGCGVSRPWPTRVSYAGSCRQGWAHSRYLTYVPD